MRRLLEVLLIHSFQKAGNETDIREGDGYVGLKTIMNKAMSDPKITISTDTAKSLSEFRELGNLSAHSITYNCKRGDIDVVRLKFRAAIEDLLYVSGIKN